MERDPIAILCRERRSADLSRIRAWFGRIMLLRSSSEEGYGRWFCWQVAASKSCAEAEASYSGCAVCKYEGTKNEGSLWAKLCSGVAEPSRSYSEGEIDLAISLM